MPENRRKSNKFPRNKFVKGVEQITSTISIHSKESAGCASVDRQR
jgi:hypothetical protein